MSDLHLNGHPFPTEEDCSDLRGSFHAKLFQEGSVKMDMVAFEKAYLALTGKWMVLQHADMSTISGDSPEIQEEIKQQLQKMIIRFENGERTLNARQLRSMVRGIRDSIVGGRSRYSVIRRLDGDVTQFRERIARGLSYVDIQSSPEEPTMQEFVLDSQKLINGDVFASAFCEYVRALPPGQPQAIFDQEVPWDRYYRDHIFHDGSNVLHRIHPNKRKQAAAGVAGEFMMQRLLQDFLLKMKNHGSQLFLRDRVHGSREVSDRLRLRSLQGHNFQFENRHGVSMGEVDAVVESNHPRAMIVFDAKTGSNTATNKPWRRGSEFGGVGLHRICVQFISKGFHATIDYVRDPSLHTVRLGLASLIPGIQKKLLGEEGKDA